MKTIAIAGASGFVGRNLIELLLKSTDYRVIGLSRSSKTSNVDRLTWAKADLFSMLDIEKAIKGADIAVYLVHSMQPSAHLDQANFADYDLILADNFGRACAKENVRQVLYLGGLIPKRGGLSKHLASRLEVEEVLTQHVPDSTIFRAAMVLGKQGSSFHILLNLVRRLPVMICPRWTELPTSPARVEKVSLAFMAAIGDEKHFGKVYDLCSSNQISYLGLLKLCAIYLGLKRRFVVLPFNFIALSKLWISLISGAPRRLVYPLVDSLKNEMVPAPNAVFPDEDFEYEPVEEALKKSIQEVDGFQYQFKTRAAERKTVRSVQRSVLPASMSARDVAMEYIAWLPKAMWPFLLVSTDGRSVNFGFISKKFILLSLRWSPERSVQDRQLFYIKGGLLAAPQDRGRLEFREAVNKKYMLAAIHDFYPALPWYFYICTQALAHLIVMKLFGRHLRLIAEGKRQWIQKH